MIEVDAEVEGHDGGGGSFVAKLGDAVAAAAAGVGEG